MVGRHRTRRAAACCCDACAASLGPPRWTRVAATAVGWRPPRWGWAAILVGATALVPVAALDDQRHAVAFSPPVAAGAVPVVIARESVARLIRVEESEPDIVWRSSTALGTPNGGRLADGVRLPSSGVGFYTYDPAEDVVPNKEWLRYGTDMLVREVLALGEWWAARYPEEARLGVGDLSLPEGGLFGGPGVGHQSHQNGLDVDIRLPRADRREARSNPANYSRELTQALTDRLIAQGATLVLIGPNLDITGPAGVVVRWPNHDGHLHVRFPDPDGAN